MGFIFSVILLLFAVKCGKAMYVEFSENSPWGWMWLILGIASVWGAIAIIQAD